MAVLTISYDTLNLTALKRLPVHRLPSSYYYSSGMGSGCAGDPPGYPSYFLNHVYTRNGNTPRRGAEAVICYEGVAYIVFSSSDWDGCQTWEQLCQKHEARLRRLWRPLPLEHPRTQAWINDTRRHHKNCYQNLMVPGDWNQRLHVGEWTFAETTQMARHLGLLAEGELLDPPAPDSEMAQDYAELAYEVRARTADATLLVQSFYPEYRHDEVTPIPVSPVTWWEALDRQPAPEECPGELRWGPGHAHPLNKQWCQVCGWHAEG